MSLKSFQLSEDFIHILPEILGLACVTGGIDSWSPAQSLNLQSCVVSETVAAFPFENKLSLLEGILLKGGPGLGNVIRQAEIHRGV